MSRATGVAALAVVAAFAVIVAAGLTDAFGSGASLRTNLGPATADGAAAATFWDSQIVDVPGVSLTAVHCHGFVQYELQVGATAPSQDNRCYAAMGAYQGSSSQWGVYELLPDGRAVYRISANYGPWRYCVGPLMSSAPLEPAGTPC